MSHSRLTYTLVGDGPSDKALGQVIDWILLQQTPLLFQRQWADTRQLRTPPHGLADRIQVALDLFPCDLLIVHRDAEAQPKSARLDEVRAALPEAAPPAVCLVPIRMTEAWFLFDESALRRAAGNPNGGVRLQLPVLQEIEKKPNPKQILHKLLLAASELSGRRSRQFSPPAAFGRLAELIDDFSPLRELSAFRDFESELQATLRSQNWL